MLRILIAEDEAHNREALGEMLRRMGHEPVLAQDGQEAFEKYTQMSFDLVLSDLRMPRLDGLGFFEATQVLAQAGAPPPPFVFMTAYGRLDEAVSAMRRGALHFLTKPLRKKDIQALIEEVEQRKNLSSEPFIDDAVFVSKAFADTVQMIDKVAASLASVLLVGESGTGKEVLARRLHQKSNRSAGPFVAFHAGAMPESLLESELFGHEKGAFTGADVSRLGQIRRAHKGTFFLDEIASTPLGVQTKLLRVLQDRTVTPLGGTQSFECDVRWVAATNTELEPLVVQGVFREDLLYRLRVVVISLPSLRSRPEDIEVLTDHFLAEFLTRENREPLQILPETRALLREYPWPGNVRELRNVIERAVALASSNVFGPELLPEHIAQVSRAREIRVAVGSSLQSVEDKLIEETLRSCGGDKILAASILGVAPRTIYRWLERRE